MSGNWRMWNNKLESQIELFKMHINWAIEVKRPIIIHNVGASSDILQLLKEKKYQGRILLHAFNDNIEVARNYLKYDCYFSFGYKIFDDKTTASKVILSLPLNRIFFETDDQVDILIDEIYLKACERLNTPLHVLENQIMQNLLTFFSDLNDLSSSDVIDHLS